MMSDWLDYYTAELNSQALWTILVQLFFVFLKKKYINLLKCK